MGSTFIARTDIRRLPDIFLSAKTIKLHYHEENILKSNRFYYYPEKCYYTSITIYSQIAKSNVPEAAETCKKLIDYFIIFFFQIAILF